MLSASPCVPPGVRGKPISQPSGGYCYNVWMLAGLCIQETLNPYGSSYGGIRGEMARGSHGMAEGREEENICRQDSEPCAAMGLPSWPTFGYRN